MRKLLKLLGKRRKSMEIGKNNNRQLADKLFYLGDIFTVDGDVDAAVETRIRIGWKNSGSWYH